MSMNNNLNEINNLLGEIRSMLLDRLKVRHIRLNIMSTKSSKLKIIAHTAGFDAEELKISLSRGQGCSGKAWNTKMEAIADLAKDVQWISDEDQERVKTGLSVILSIPLFDPDVPNLKRVIGTLTIDSTERIYEPIQKIVPSLMPHVQKIADLVKKSGL